jgi:hypothetical protein
MSLERLISAIARVLRVRVRPRLKMRLRLRLRLKLRLGSRLSLNLSISSTLFLYVGRWLSLSLVWQGYILCGSFSRQANGFCQLHGVLVMLSFILVVLLFLIVVPRKFGW